MMTGTRTTTTNTNHYFGVLVLVAALAASLLLTQAQKPAQASTTFSVNLSDDRSDANPGDGTCSVVNFGAFCSLRAAIEEANAVPGADTITFDIPAPDVATVSPDSPLPTITDQVTIDGYTQTGASPNTLQKGTNAVLKVELNGAEAGAADGLNIDAGGSGSVLRGLAINRFSNEGIFISGGTVTNVKIEGNFVGTDPSGMVALPNHGDGIEMDASNSVVGGSLPAQRNLISGNDVEGLSVSGDAKNVKVKGNLIGTQADGVSALGNLFNGVDISDGSVGVSILSNSIFSNGRLGIDLGVDGRTTNDPADPDAGANGLQNFPVISSATNASGKTTVKGKLNSRPDAGYLIQFFSNPSGTNEGRRLIGEKSVTTDGSGNASFTFSPATTVAVGQTITATATRTSTGNTSEFSVPRKVVAS